MKNKLRRVTYKITYMSLFIILDSGSTYQIEVETWQNDQLNRYTNYLICIFMNYNENIRNMRKLVEKLRGIPTKLPLHQLLTILYYKIWYPLKG